MNMSRNEFNKIFRKYIKMKRKNPFNKYDLTEFFESDFYDKNNDIFKYMSVFYDNSMIEKLNCLILSSNNIIKCTNNILLKNKINIFVISLNFEIEKNNLFKEYMLFRKSIFYKEIYSLFIVNKKKNLINNKYDNFFKSEFYDKENDKWNYMSIFYGYSSIKELNSLILSSNELVKSTNRVLLIKIINTFIDFLNFEIQKINSYEKYREYLMSKHESEFYDFIESDEY